MAHAQQGRFHKFLTLEEAVSERHYVVECHGTMFDDISIIN